MSCSSGRRLSHCRKSKITFPKRRIRCTKLTCGELLDRGSVLYMMSRGLQCVQTECEKSASCSCFLCLRGQRRMRYGRMVDAPAQRESSAPPYPRITISFSGKHLPELRLNMEFR